MTNHIEKAVLYCQGTFDHSPLNPITLQQMMAAAKDIAQSGFGTVNLSQWHVHEDGSIYYNDTPLAQVRETLKLIVPILKSRGSVCTVLISFGPFATDFKAIEDNLPAFQKEMEELVAYAGIDGFDWDLEQNYDAFPQLLVELTLWANGLNKMVTAAPYDDFYIDFWTSVLKETNRQGSAGFAWWNLQLYGGATYSSWAKCLIGIVPSPGAFLVPAYSVKQGGVDAPTPAALQYALEELRMEYPIAGAAIWRYEDLKDTGYTTADFANAIAAALTSNRNSIRAAA